MKLRNKKTGEVIEWSNNTDGIFPNTLAELNEEWEDYEEPKKYWYIGDRGEIFPEIVENPGHIWHQARKEIGNYFETEEEAEKAVEKLKAWKRLRNEGFRFRAFESDIVTMNHKNISMVKIQATMECVGSNIDQDLDLLFGGEEEDES